RYPRTVNDDGGGSPPMLKVPVWSTPEHAGQHRMRRRHEVRPCADEVLQRRSEGLMRSQTALWDERNGEPSSLAGGQYRPVPHGGMRRHRAAGHRAFQPAHEELGGLNLHLIGGDILALHAPDEYPTFRVAKAGDCPREVVPI